MQAEHHAAAASDAATTEMLAAWVADPSSGKASSLAGSLGDLRSVLGAHLEDEERSFLPIAATTFTAEEWGQLAGDVARTFSGDKLWLILGLIVEQMTEEQRAFTRARMPPPVAEMWSSPGAASVAAFIADVPGTSVTPVRHLRLAAPPESRRDPHARSRVGPDRAASSPTRVAAARFAPD
jgi:hypothetical protein